MILRLSNTFYLLILGICIGGIILCAISATTIFNADRVLRDSGLSDLVITKYDSGILMTDIFIKFGYLLNISAVIILVYESLSFRFQKSGALIWLLNVFNAILIFLFTFYYIPSIVSMQLQGAGIVGGVEFESVHSQSELVFKILLGTLILSFISRTFIIYSDFNESKSRAKPASSKNTPQENKRKISIKKN